MTLRLIPLLAFLIACSGRPAPGDKPQSDPPPDAAAPAPAPPEPVAVAPPAPDYDTSQWTELISLDSTFLLDLRYATTNNFVDTQLYDCPRCFLRPPVARALARVHGSLQQKGYRLKLFDCYRPRPVQWALWEKIPDPRYVSDPRKGSMHNRGAAVDLTLTDPAGRQLDMGTAFDFFGPKAHPGYSGLPDSILERRRLLSNAMQAEGFRPITTEWWHFSYPAAAAELSDMVWNCPEKE